MDKINDCSSSCPPGCEDGASSEFAHNHNKQSGGVPVGELCTVSGASEYSNSVDLPQIFLCESNESLLGIFGLENFTCVAEVCSSVPNLDNSIVNDCGDTQLRTSDTCTAARRTVYSVSEIPSKRSLASQKVLCQEHSLFCDEDVCIDSADERSCVVPCASGYSIVGDPALRTCMTQGAWTDGGLLTCEPQACADLSLGSSVVSDCDGTLYRITCTVSCASGYVISDMNDAVFQCLAFPGFPDGCVLLNGTGQEFDGLEGIAHTYDGVGLGDNCEAEGTHERRHHELDARILELDHRVQVCFLEAEQRPESLAGLQTHIEEASASMRLETNIVEIDTPSVNPVQVRFLEAEQAHGELVWSPNANRGGLRDNAN